MFQLIVEELFASLVSFAEWLHAHDIQINITVIGGFVGVIMLINAVLRFRERMKY